MSCHAFELYTSDSRLNQYSKQTPFYHQYTTVWNKYDYFGSRRSSRIAQTPEPQPPRTFQKMHSRQVKRPPVSEQPRPPPLLGDGVRVVGVIPLRERAFIVAIIHRKGKRLAFR